MKMANRIILATLFAGALLLSVAQAQTDSPKPDMPTANAGDEILPPRIQRFFDKLKEDDPQKYDRLLKLRESDPEAYRQALRERLRDAREQRGMRDGDGAPALGIEVGPRSRLSAIGRDVMSSSATCAAATGTHPILKWIK
ncbi:MAG: hypothetical protein M5U15_01225 [Kiritimatiellae bacterium]|nr:hypothetical protein [Kiritimatiellia bacterium]